MCFFSLSAPLPQPKDRAKHITANGHGMRKHSRKSFWFFFFRTDAASESRDRSRAMPSGEEENKRSAVKKNGSIPDTKNEQQKKG